MARSSYKHRPRVHTVWNSPKRNTALMLAEVRDHADRGEVVQIVRAGGRVFQVILNGDCYLTRSVAGDALATSGTLLEAVMAGDAWLDQAPVVDHDDGFPRGAA